MVLHEYIFLHKIPDDFSDSKKKRKCPVQALKITHSIYLDTLINFERTYNCTAYTTSLRHYSTSPYFLAISLNINPLLSCLSNVALRSSLKTTLEKSVFIYFFARLGFCCNAYLVIICLLSCL